MNDARIDQLLRRAADDVNAAVRSATPPPIDELGGQRSRSTTVVTLVCAVLVVAAGVGLVLLGERDDAIAPAVAPLPEASTAEDAGPSRHPCQSVVDISRVLESRPASTEVWADLAVQIDELEALVSTADVADPAVRRYERFVALARQAAELGAAGGFTPATSPADDALAVAEDLVEFVAAPDCRFRRSTNDSAGG